MATTISWVDPIKLDYVSALQEAKLLSALRKQLRAGIFEHGAPEDLARCVYVVRMTGPVVVAYPRGNSPVLYVGRGDAPKRLAAHLKKWLHDVHSFGNDARVELRICIPRRPNRTEFYKNVEADLIKWFQDEYGAIPFFNARLESSYAGVIDYLKTQEKDLRRALGVGSGNKPEWAIRPLRSNKNHAVYETGWVD